jgi:hypothetical protein
VEAFERIPIGFPSIGFIRWLFYVCIERQIFLSDLKTRAPPTVSDALVIDGNALPAATEWTQQLIACGIRARYLALPGLTEMIMTASQFAQIPHEMVAASRVNRMHVTLAREWANRGYVALRMDLAGMGDSVRYRTDAWISPVQTELGLLDHS